MNAEFQRLDSAQRNRKLRDIQELEFMTITLNLALEPIELNDKGDDESYLYEKFNSEVFIYTSPSEEK